jgi:hypothetical protein
MQLKHSRSLLLAMDSSESAASLTTIPSSMVCVCTRISWRVFKYARPLALVVEGLVYMHACGSQVLRSHKVLPLV